MSSSVGTLGMNVVPKNRVHATYTVRPVNHAKYNIPDDLSFSFGMAAKRGSPGGRKKS